MQKLLRYHPQNTHFTTRNISSPLSSTHKIVHPSLEVPPPTDLGIGIPQNTSHALSVSLPKWSDVVGYASADPTIVNVITTGYPRNFIHKSIQKLADICLENLGYEDQLALLFPGATIAHECIAYFRRYSPETDPSHITAHAINIPLGPSDQQLYDKHYLELHVVVSPHGLQKLGKEFWKYTGMGITSRFAEACLASIDKYGVRLDLASHLHPSQAEQTRQAAAKCSVLRRRIATLSAHGTLDYIPQSVMEQTSYPSENDVYLYSSGMSAIWHAHQLGQALNPGLKPVCFGFSYTHTVKVLEKWGPGCIFYGDHPNVILEAFETFLRHSAPSFTSGPPISAVFCECPSNPLLQSPNLPRLRQLADQYGFLIIVDDVIGNFVNVDVLQYVDIVNTSLSKLFSGEADVMGGSLILNPQSRHYIRMKSVLDSIYVNVCFLPDLAKLEANSRDFEERVYIINANTQAVCHYLREHCEPPCSDDPKSVQLTPPSTPPLRRFAIKEIFYPEWITRKNYEFVRRDHASDRVASFSPRFPPTYPNNFGSLFSLTFTSLEAAEAFYDALPCAKGPLWGANFTLSCPYTILGHYWELEWAKRYGVDEYLVRVSVGMEDIEVLMRWFKYAVDAAEKVCSMNER